MKSAITPVSIFPTVANQLEIDDSWAFTGTPRLNYRLQNNAHDSTPAVAAIFDADDVLVSAAVPAKPDTITTLKEGLINLTDTQWSAWTNQGDNPYLLQCAAANLGLTLA